LVKRRRDQWGASLWSDDKETRPSVSLWKEETFFKFLSFHIFIFTLRSLSLSPELVDSFSIVSFFFLSLSTQSWQTNLIVHRDWTISNELIFGFITRRIIIIDTFMLLYIAPGEYLNTVVETTPVSQLPGIVIQKQTAHNHRKNIISCFLNFLVWAETFWASNYWMSYFSSICIYTLRTRTIRQCYRVYGGENCLGQCVQSFDTMKNSSSLPFVLFWDFYFFVGKNVEGNWMYCTCRTDF
jgi:hypothetical protein